MSETGLVVIVGGILAAVGMGYYMGRKGQPMPPPSVKGVSYNPLPLTSFAIHKGAPSVVDTPPPPDAPPKPRGPRAPSDTEMYYREVEGPPKEHW